LFVKYSILGMNLFGCKFCENQQPGQVCGRKNFDTLLWATITVFQVSFVWGLLQLFSRSVFCVDYVGYNHCFQCKILLWATMTVFQVCFFCELPLQYRLLFSRYVSYVGFCIWSNFFLWSTIIITVFQVNFFCQLPLLFSR